MIVEDFAFHLAGRVGGNFHLPGFFSLTLSQGRWYLGVHKTSAAPKMIIPKESTERYFSQFAPPENAFTVFVGISASGDLKKIEMLMQPVFIGPVFGNVFVYDCVDALFLRQVIKRNPTSRRHPRLHRYLCVDVSLIHKQLGRYPNLWTPTHARPVCSQTQPTFLMTCSLGANEQDFRVCFMGARISYF